jgi:hypothetical protein
MTQSLTETLTEAAQAAAKADHSERDREAWNLPRARAETKLHGTYREVLDWNGFRDLHYPDSRRHDLRAIVGYGAYRKSLPAARPASEAACPTSDSISVVAHSNGVAVS